jgi:hypothetical protein
MDVFALSFSVADPDPARSGSFLPDPETNLDFVPHLAIHNYLCMKKGPFLQIL